MTQSSKMVVKKKREWCEIRDHSPLSLLGIFLITAGVIIAIYDAKDALPNNTESYVITIGILLTIGGFACIVMAFLGYRRSRALARETSTDKIRSDGRGRARRVSVAARPRKQPDGLSSPGRGSVNISTVSYPEIDDTGKPSVSKAGDGSLAGRDNPSFQQSPSNAPSYTLLDPSGEKFGYPQTDLQDRPIGTNENEHIHWIKVEQQGVPVLPPYIPALPPGEGGKVPEYVPPVSTIV